MIVGFTGTRDGLTSVQHARLKLIASKLSLSVFFHGGSRGADTLAHHAFRRFNPTSLFLIFPAYTDQGSIVTYPTNPDLNIIFDPRDPLKRNRLIVRYIQGLVAAPNSMNEQLRSGTWYTVRRARERGVPILFVWPDGTSTLERNNG